MNMLRRRVIVRIGRVVVNSLLTLSCGGMGSWPYTLICLKRLIYMQKVAYLTLK